MDTIKKLTNCKIMSTITQESDEEAWLAARTHGIGGSDVGAICGVSPFSTPRQIYMKKTGQFEDAVEPGTAAMDRMHFGHMLEPVVADEYAIRSGARLKVINATLSHKDHPWALANIDRLIVDENDNPIGVLECKTTGEYMNDNWEDGDILESYLYQLNWYLWILGLDKGVMACLVGGNKYYYYEMFRNDDLLNNIIIPQARDFWFDNVKKLVEPALAANDKDMINEKYSKTRVKAEIILADDTANELAKTIMDCKAKIKELKATQDEAETRIKDKLGENEFGYTTDYTIKWSPRVRNAVDSSLLKKNYPDIHAAVMKATEYKVLLVKGVKL